MLLIHQMKANVPFNNFGHQRVHRAPRQAEILCSIAEHSASVVQLPFNRFYLTPDAPHAVQQLSFFIDCVRHISLYKYTP